MVCKIKKTYLLSASCVIYVLKECKCQFYEFRNYIIYDLSPFTETMKNKINIIRIILTDKMKVANTI